MFSFALEATSGRARAGVLHTPHGVVETPAFMPVGTAGVVKALTPRDLRDAGAQILAGGTLDGELLRPTVIANAPPDAKVSSEEVFGPVCTVSAYDTLDEAVALANGTRYGLQAGIFTRDLKAALTASFGLEFGGVTVNEAPTFRADQMPYGGVKDSGNTREGPAYAVSEMTEERLVVLQL